MADEVVSVVDPDSGAGYDYASLNAWESAQDGDIVTADEQHTAKCRSTGGSADTTAVTIDGWTTSDTCFIKIWTNPEESYRHDGKWNTGAYRISATDIGALSGVIHVKDNYVKLYGLQVELAGSAGNDAAGIQFYDDPDHGHVESCIIKKGAATNIVQGIRVHDCNEHTFAFVNCIIYDFTGTSDWNAGISTNQSSSNAVVYNCTLVNNKKGIHANHYVCKNVLAQGNTSADFDGGEDGDYNCSEDASAPGANSYTEISVAFEDEAGDDYHLDSSEDGNIEGTDLSADGTYAFSDDIDGDTRSDWDIGADEYVAAGAVIEASCTDGIRLSDLSSRTAIFSASCTDGVAMGDSNFKTAQLIAQTSDGVVLSDNTIRSVAMIAQAADGITASDQINAIATLLSAVADGVKGSDSASASAALGARASDGTVFSDAVSALKGIISAACADGITLSDSNSVQAQLQSAASDGVKLSETITTVLQAVAATSDGVVFSDSTNWGAILQALANDGITLSDTASRTLRMFVQAADSVILSDSGAVNATYTVECSDEVQFADSVAAIMKFVAMVSDGVKFADTVLEVSQLPRGYIRIKYSTKSVSLTFDVKAPSASFRAQKPGVTFDTE